MPSAVSEEKLALQKDLNRLIDTYERLVFVKLDNVTSQQMHKVRRDLLGKAEIVVGKKTTQKKIMVLRAERKDATPADHAMVESLVKQNLLTGNLALCFTNLKLPDLTEVFTRYRVQAPARVGAVSPVEVIIPAGNTGMEPTQTSFFQALNIMTKINKGTVEIVNDKKVLSPGDKVDTSTAALLQKLNISPFFYNPEVVYVWEKGMLFTLEDLNVTDEAIEAAFATGVSRLTGLSLGAGIVTELSLPHAIADGFKTLLAAAVATDYSFSEYDGAKLIADIKSGKAAAAAAPAAAAAAAAPAAAAKDEKKDDKKAAAPAKKDPEPAPADDDDMIGGLF
jgi:large subunit ribosomal protein LP0